MRARTSDSFSPAVLDLGIDQGGGIPHQAEKGGGIGNKVEASFGLVWFVLFNDTWSQ